MAVTIQWREPDIFASGDTLMFQRFLPDFLPSDGWALLYTLTQPTPAGANKVAQFESAPSATDPSCHAINVPNFGAGLPAGDFVLSAQAVNAAGNVALNIAAGTKQTIYYGELELDPDLADGLAAAPIVTFVQKMIPILEAKICRLESFDLTETDVQRTHLIVEDKNKTYERYWRLLEFRNWEKKKEATTNTGRGQDTIPFAVGPGW